MSDTIKVLVVIGQLEIGGTEQHLLRVLPRLADDTLSCTVYALRGGGELERQFAAAGVRVIAPRHHSRRWLGLLRTAWHFIGVLRAERPHIVHYFLPEAYLLGGLSGLFGPPCRRVMSRRSLNDYQRRRPLAGVIERVLHKRMDWVLGNSAAVLAQLHAEGVAQERSSVIYNGVVLPALDDAAPRAPLEPPVDDDQLVLIVVANLIPYKGHADVIEALRLLRDDMPADWCVLMLGADRGIQAELERQAAVAGIAANVRWIGTVVDVQSYFSRADVAIQASHEEGFSNAILEAMAAAVPLVVTAVGGNTEAVVDGETGFVVPPRDPPALAAALARLVKDAALRARLGAAARVRVRTHFALDECTAAYRRLYLRLGRDAAGAQP